MQAIQSPIIATAWKKFHPSPQETYDTLYNEFHAEQPFLAAYLKMTEERLYPEKPGLLSYLGVFIYILSKEQLGPVSKVSVETILQLEANRLKFLKDVEEESEYRAKDMVSTALTNHPQCILLGFLCEQMFEGYEDAPQLAPDNTEHSLHTLIIAVDALISATP